MGICAFCGKNRAMYTCFLMYKPEEGEFKHVNQACHQDYKEGIYGHINFHDKCSDDFHFRRVFTVGNHMLYFRTAFDREQWEREIRKSEVEAILTLNRESNLLMIEICGITTVIHSVCGLKHVGPMLWVIGNHRRGKYGRVLGSIFDKSRCIIKEKWG